MGQAVWEERKEKRNNKRDVEQDQKNEPAGKKIKVERVEEADVDSGSEDEGWNGGLWRFAGTNSVVTKKDTLEDEQKFEVVLSDGDGSHTKVTSEYFEEKTEAEIDDIVKSGNENKFDTKLNDSSDDEAPEEVKTIVSYENVVEEADDLAESKSSRKPRKRKKKAVEDIKAGNPVLEPSQITEVEHSLFDDANPPIPGEDNPEAASAFVKPVNYPSVSHTFKPSNSSIQKHPSSLPAKSNRPPVFDQRMRPPTLLEKLLLNEIKKERNKILQCVRFVCKNNFFQGPESDHKT